MELIELIDVASLEGKKYIFYYMGDFTQYAQVNFLREKS